MTATDEELMALPHLNWRTFITETEKVSAENLEVLDEYFEPFQTLMFGKDKEGKETLPPQKCLGCGHPLGGMFAGLFGPGGFRWGIAHGEGHCSYCGWPGRAHHFVRRPDGTVIATLRNFILMYHPVNVNMPAIRHRIIERERKDDADE